MSKGELKYWENSMGGDTGSKFLDATSATAVATGLQCSVIDVREATAFSVLTGYDLSAGATVDFRVDNGLTGLTIEAGLIFPGYGRYFTSISITSGQVAYNDKKND